jgi:putative nucleotidyltransferase with HDIG domain
MGSLKRISADQLLVGMYVTDQTEGLSKSGLKKSGFIRKEEIILKILASGIEEVWIDVEKGIDSDFSRPIVVEEILLEPVVPLAEEVERAEKIHTEALGIVDDIYQNVKAGKAIDIACTEQVADGITGSVSRNKNALLCLTQIRDKDQYLLEHSVNVAVLMSIFATYLGYEQDTVQQLVTGALLHDIGKTQVPDAILNKPAKLTPDEQAELQRHVEYGQQALASTKDISDVVVSICAQHHERIDGKGYPQGLDNSGINTYGRMAAIVNIYDKLTGKRLNSNGMVPFKAMQQLSKLSGSHLDKELVYSFIRCMGIYPVGALVQLNNGRMGVVTESRIDKPNQPTVRVFYNTRQKCHEPAKTLDLSSPLIEVDIIGVADPSNYDIDIKDFLV